MVRLASHAVHVAAPRRIQQHALPLRCEVQSVKLGHVRRDFSPHEKIVKFQVSFACGENRRRNVCLAEATTMPRSLTFDPPSEHRGIQGID